VLLVLQRYKVLAADCAARSRMQLLLQLDEFEVEVRELHQDLATLLDLFPSWSCQGRHGPAGPRAAPVQAVRAVGPAIQAE
jgi:hypothetical protein